MGLLVGLLDRLRPDPRCGRCTRIRAACICTVNPSKALRRQPPRVKTPRK